MIRTINGAIEELRTEDPVGLRCPPLFGHEKGFRKTPKPLSFGDRERIRTAGLPLRSFARALKHRKDGHFPMAP